MPRCSWLLLSITYPFTRAHTFSAYGRHDTADAHAKMLCFYAEFCCNGTVVEDPELGKVIQLQGDQRKNVSTFLVSNNIAKKDLIKIHGF